MIAINLVPSTQRRPGSARGVRLRLPSIPVLGGRSRTTAAGAAVLLVLLPTLGVRHFQGTRQRLESRIAVEAADSARFATTLALLDALRARQDSVQQRIGVIRAVDRRRYVWPHLLDEVSRALPAYTWLAELRASESGDTTAIAGPSFVLLGSAGSTQALTRFMKNLEASPFIRDVTLVTSERETMEGRTLHRFTLEASYQSPPRERLETVPVVILEG